MRLAAGTTRIEGGKVVDGTGATPVDSGVVIIAEGRISYVRSAEGAPETPAAEVVNAAGCSVIPGLVEAHWHASYFNVLELEDLDIAHPPEKVAIRSAINARIALECGYTSARSAGCLFNTDVWLSEAIEDDLVPGPRFTPGGQEICGAGGLMDWNPEFRKIGMEGVILVVGGPDQARSAARKLVKNGVHWLKAFPTGDAAAPDTNDRGPGDEVGTKRAGRPRLVLRAGLGRLRRRVRDAPSRDRRPPGDLGRRHRVGQDDSGSRWHPRDGRGLRVRPEPAWLVRPGAHPSS